MNATVAFLLFILEGWVPSDDAIVVLAGKMRKLWDTLSELRSSLCERRLERTVLRPALLAVKTAQFTPSIPSGMTSHRKIAQFNWECIAPLTAELTRKGLRSVLFFNSVLPLGFRTILSNWHLSPYCIAQYRYAIVQLIEAPRYKPKGRGLHSEGVIGICHWLNHCDCNMVLGSIQPRTEMNTRNISWRIKAAGA